jgi:hypothetical protein
MISYCKLCERKVETRRKVGIGTLLLTILTAGWWLFAILFYRKRCPLCE